jgi:23S rRNA (uracil1939-C5)-methyltransferase
MNVKNSKTGEFRAEAVSVDEFLGRRKKVQKPDFILLDPPRAGLGEASARHLAEVGAPHITYVSCDPATMARDLRILTLAGYRVLELHLLDLFPQTYHIETVVHLSR